ncbi:TolB family protein [Metabacillus litoralis]|uniref:TolB family protein n=1 Tax=Metabacillus litoralis TaxID=152268 RepID=UPI001CFC8D8A|nr:DPP IV N-terminal domain-containing protein [Metabacillus litoralis]
MKQNRIIFILAFIFLVLIVSSFLTILFGEKDPYKYFTGLGSELAVSPNDEEIAFSYFLDGNEAIYKAGLDGSNIIKVTKGSKGRYHTPRFSVDGKEILYLSKDDTGINRLTLQNLNTSTKEQLTENTMHVTDAVFSQTGEKVYFIGIQAEEFKKAEGETREGYDLYQVDVASKEVTQLTDQDHFSMNDLSISKDGKTLYYSLFNEFEQLYSYTIENEKQAPLEATSKLNHDIYSSVLSYDEQLLAYTAVSEETEDTSLFAYELFVKNLETNETKRLTDLQTNIHAPTFFHQSNQMIFLENKNWPEEPEEYQLMTMSITDDVPEVINLELPVSKENHFIMKILESLLSGVALAVYYILFFSCFTVLAQRNSRKVFLPFYISISLAVVLFLSSFVVGALSNPWNGLGIAMLSVGILGCSLVLLLLTFIVKKIVKPV